MIHSEFKARDSLRRWPICCRVPKRRRFRPGPNCMPGFVFLDATPELAGWAVLNFMQTPIPDLGRRIGVKLKTYSLVPV